MTWNVLSRYGCAVEEFEGEQIARPDLYGNWVTERGTRVVFAEEGVVLKKRTLEFVLHHENQLTVRMNSEKTMDGTVTKNSDLNQMQINFTTGGKWDKTDNLNGNWKDGLGNIHRIEGYTVYWSIGGFEQFSLHEKVITITLSDGDHTGDVNDDFTCITWRSGDIWIKQSKQSDCPITPEIGQNKNEEEEQVIQIVGDEKEDLETKTPAGQAGEAEKSDVSEEPIKEADALVSKTKKPNSCCAVM